MRRKRKSSPTLILFVAAVALSVIPLSYSTSFKTFIMSLLAPVHKGAASASSSVRAVSDNISKYFRDTRDYQKLLDRVQGLTNRVNESEGIKLENQRLRDLLDFQESFEHKTIAARVIGWDTNAWASSIIISKGRKKGVREDMAVIYESGLVGRVIEAGWNVSKVLLVTDPKNKVGARLQRTREIGIVQGTSANVCRVSSMSRAADVKIGDLVVTSGLSAFYPPGIPIGSITEVYTDEDTLSQYAYLRPCVEMSKLEEVLVVQWKED